MNVQVLYMRIMRGNIRGCINLYRTILVLHNNYASLTTPTSSKCALRTFISKNETSHFNQCSSTSQIIMLVMTLLCCFQSTTSLPTAKETRFRDTVTRSANTAVLHDVQKAKWLWKHKTYTAFTAEQRAAIYASKHGTPATKTPFRTVFMFKADFGGWIARRKRHLLVCYIKVLKKARHSGAAVPEVKTIGSMKWEQPVTLGDVDTNVQAYIKPCWHSCVHVWTLSWLLQRE